MTIRHLVADTSHCLRTAALPMLALGLLTSVRTVDPALGTSDGILSVAWQAANVASTAWLILAVAWAANRRWRDCRAHQRLQHLRDLAAQPDHALVQVQTTIWTTAAGQCAVVLNIATGVLHRVWLPETTVPSGAFAVLERTGHGGRVVACVDARGVKSAHRHERRRRRLDTPAIQPEPAREVGELQEAADLIDEVEKYLKARGGA